MHGNSTRENRETPRVPRSREGGGPVGEGQESGVQICTPVGSRTVAYYRRNPNKGGQPPAESNGGKATGQGEHRAGDRAPDRRVERLASVCVRQHVRTSGRGSPRCFITFADGQLRTLQRRPAEFPPRRFVILRSKPLETLRSTASTALPEDQKIQTGKANENGDVEQRHHRLKRAVDQQPAVFHFKMSTCASRRRGDSSVGRPQKTE